MLNDDERPSLVQLRKIGRDLRQNLHKERQPNTPFWIFEILELKFWNFWNFEIFEIFEILKFLKFLKFWNFWNFERACSTVQDKHNVTGDKLKNDWKSEAGNLFFGLKKIKKFKIQNSKFKFKIQKLKWLKMILGKCWTTFVFMSRLKSECFWVKMSMLFFGHQHQQQHPVSLPFLELVPS